MNIPAPGYRTRRVFNTFCILVAAFITALGVLHLGPAVTALGSVLLLVNTWAVADATRHIRERTPGLPQRSRRHVGEIYLSELPGFLWILLAGPEYRRQAAAILERRARKTEVAAVTPKPLVRASCMRCGAPHPLVNGRCRPCYALRQQRLADRRAARDLMGPLPDGVSPRCPHGHPLTHPAACVTCQNQRRP